MTYARTGSAFALFCFLYFAMLAIGNLTESKPFFLLWPEWSIFVALAVAFVRSRQVEAAGGRRSAPRSARRRTLDLDAATARPATMLLAVRPRRR